MSRTLKDVLCNELSPDRMGDYTPNELADFLVTNGIVSNAADVNRLTIEALQRAFTDGDEFPIHYYGKGEEMSEEAKYPPMAGQCLTDEYIEQNMNKE